MCEIFYAHSQDKGNTLDKGQLDQLLDSALDASMSNPHGWGIFDDMGKMMKSAFPFDPEAKDKIMNRFKESNFIVLHLRHATHGSTHYSNTHPFTAGNYFLVHNGVLDSNPIGDRTDSELLLHKIISKGNLRISEKISKTMDNNGGSVSCFLYNSNVDELYYWRNGSSFEFAYDPESKMLFGATKKMRLKTSLGVNKLGFFEHMPDRIMTQTPGEDKVLKIDSKIQLASTFDQPNRYTGSKFTKRGKDREQGQKHLDDVMDDLNYDPKWDGYISPYQNKNTRGDR